MIDGGLVVDTVAVEPVSASNPQTEYFPSIKKGVGGTIRNPNSLRYLDSTKTRVPVYKKGGWRDDSQSKFPAIPRLNEDPRSCG
jgi:hypothetical protein